MKGGRTKKQSFEDDWPPLEALSYPEILTSADLSAVSSSKNKTDSVDAQSHDETHYMVKNETDFLEDSRSAALSFGNPPIKILKRNTSETSAACQFSSLQARGSHDIKDSTSPGTNTKDSQLSFEERKERYYKMRNKIFGCNSEE